MVTKVKMGKGKGKVEKTKTEKTKGQGRRGFGGVNYGMLGDILNMTVGNAMRLERKIEDYLIPKNKKINAKWDAKLKKDGEYNVLTDSPIRLGGPKPIPKRDGGRRSAPKKSDNKKTKPVKNKKK